MKENLLLLRDLLEHWKGKFLNIWELFIDKYKNTVHKTIKMKPIDVAGDSYAEYNENPNKKDPKLVTMLEFQNIKAFLLNDILQIGQKKFSLLEKLKIQFLGHT